MDLFDLRGDHTENFSFNAIEFIETTPSSSLDQSREDRPHCLVIQPLTTIKHNTQQRQRFRQILRCLRFTYYQNSSIRFLSIQVLMSIAPVPAGPAGAPPRWNVKAVVKVI